MGNQVKGKVQRSFYLDTEVAEELRRAAFERRESQSEIVKRALTQYLKEASTMNRTEFAKALGFGSEEELREASEHVVNQADIDWWIAKLPDGRWAAWDDAEIDLDRVTYHDNRENALREQFYGFVDAEPEARWTSDTPTWAFALQDDGTDRERYVLRYREGAFAEVFYDDTSDPNADPAWVWRAVDTNGDHRGDIADSKESAMREAFEAVQTGAPAYVR